MNETVMSSMAKPMLILAPLIWGTSFVVMKQSWTVSPFFPAGLPVYRRRGPAGPRLLEILAGDGPGLSERRDAILSAHLVFGLCLPDLRPDPDHLGQKRVPDGGILCHRPLFILAHRGQRPDKLGIFWPPLSAWRASVWWR